MSKRSNDVVDGLKRKQLDDLELRGGVICAFIVWGMTIWMIGGTLGFWIGLVLCTIIIIGSVMDWWPKDERRRPD